MLYVVLWMHWWRCAAAGDICTKCMRPGHVAASCKSPLWAAYRE